MRSFTTGLRQGRLLAARLLEFDRRPDGIVLALPRGGVPVGFEIAARLHLPLDVFVVRKLGVPGQPELAFGAIASGGVRVLNEEIVREFALSPSVIEAVAAREQIELKRREREYRPNRPTLDISGRFAILVDDGLATGSSMRAAAQALRRRQSSEIVAAIPVAAPEVCSAVAADVDRIVCLRRPERLMAVGQWYRDFAQVTDAEVRQLLDRCP